MYLLIFYLISLFTIGSFEKDCGLINESEERTFPWITNVYKMLNSTDHKFMCSGTLISPKIIVTAASCFYNSGNKLKKEKFFVTIGQRYKNWNTQMNATQEISIENIFIKPKIFMNSLYSDNIAIIKLGSGQKIVEKQPVCVNWENEFVDLSVKEYSSKLKLATWRISNNSMYEVVEPSIFDWDLCNSYFARKKVQQLLTYDKLCLELKDVKAAPTVGSGIYKHDDTNDQWFLIGVVSENIVTDANIYVTFVKINSHLNWISHNVFLDL